MNILRTIVAAVSVVSLAAVTAACGTSATPASGPASGSPAASAALGTPHPAAFNASDVTFARLMVMLGSQAGQIAGLAPGRAAAGPVRRYAALAVGRAREGERQARGWLHAWHQAVPGPWPPGAVRPYQMGPGMMGPGMMGGSGGWSGYWAGMGRGWHAMTGMRGPGFDTAWTAMMARGYATAITTARGELRSGINPAARAMARSMMGWWQAGLTRMQSWYRSWGGPGWNRPGWWSRWNGWHWPSGWTPPHPGGPHSRWHGWNGGCRC